MRITGKDEGMGGEMYHGPGGSDPEIGSDTILRALAGGLAAALIGGILWGLIVHFTGYEVGYAAWGMGALCGWSVLMATGKKRGKPIQFISAFSSVIGIVLGKYFAYYAIIRQIYLRDRGAEVAGSLSVFMPDMIRGFLQDAHHLMEGMDILFVIFAVGTAWVITSPGKRPEAEKGERVST